MRPAHRGCAQLSLTLGLVQLPQSIRFPTRRRWFSELETFSCENGSFDKGLSLRDGDNQNEKISSWIKMKRNAKLKQLHFLFWHFPFKTPQNPLPAVWKCSFSDFFFFICFTGGKEFGNADISRMRYFKLYLGKLCLQVHWVRLGSLHPTPRAFQKTCWKISNLNNILPILKAKLVRYVFSLKIQTLFQDFKY